MGYSPAPVVAAAWPVDPAAAPHWVNMASTGGFADVGRSADADFGVVHGLETDVHGWRDAQSELFLDILRRYLAGRPLMW